MKYAKRISLLFFSLFILSAFPRDIHREDYIENEVIIRFKDYVGKTQEHRSVIARDLSVRKGFRTFKNLYLFKTPSGSDVQQTIRELEKDPDILYAEPNYIYKLCDNIPDDTYFYMQWGLPKIKAPAAWDITTGNKSIIIVVIDTGIDYTHTDLADNMWVNQVEYEGIEDEDDDSNGIVDDIYGAVWTEGDGSVTSGDPMDDHDKGHGTHCAGIIGAQGNNGFGVCGVNWNVNIMALKFIERSSGTGSLTDAISCIDYIISMYERGENIVAVSNSWGGYNDSRSLYEAIESLKDKGILFIAAAGNSNNDNDLSPLFPASYELPNVISVASSEQYDNRSYFSNYGRNSVDIAAPGSDILSTLRDNYYGNISGTSMATPFVAGASGLLSARTGVVDYTQLKKWILQGVTRLHQWTNLTVTGGILNLAESLRIAGLPAEINSVTDFSATKNGSNINLVWVLPSGAEGVIIRRGTTFYPARWDEGTEIYNGIGEFFADGNVVAGTPYYYSCWAYYGVGAGSMQLTKENLSPAAYAYVNSPPNRPECVLPADNAEDLKLPLLLTATGFKDPDSDIHQASQWQVSIDERFEFSSVDRVTAGVTNTTLDSGSLVSNATYYWRVRYQDEKGEWSEWSDVRKFTTESSSSGGSGGGGGGGCFIATAAFGSPIEPHVRIFREFRDRRLLTNPAGRAFVRWYYRHSPRYAAIISRNRILKYAARTVLAPLCLLVRIFL